MDKNIIKLYMGNLCPCLFKSHKKDLEDHLVRYMYCNQCQRLYLSNYEYNKHIYECNQRYNNKQT